MQDTSVYGIVTDSFRWDFIQIRANSEMEKSKAEIVSVLYEIFETAACSSAQPQQQRKRWRQGSDTEFTTELDKPSKIQR
ncbi:uncharacterized protein N7518_004960 [Penicillium psychrosexuale]|uniref:uncharacterized protein n=1 Tax=Penicillium psychrosexuale TaxID=1002107 RepID=UPI0025453284|nr:uncharacterized protein N7518_004960 [Penicillium psychrosexuale]KAI3144378.1 hypothetical protein CBS147326_1382 [Penicillium roqueforti]KAI3242294.1 hypothetical protein CBS147310_144 [Penicillium roqueforti]KAI3269483.1 hypothetical protein DTO012A9_977 [Penicillium roqueforti]KAJ5796420.1 hypothetical protein N7518_004960 [Penicillium psychrosexuale]